MSHLHVPCLDLVDEGGQPGGVDYFPDADSGPPDNEIAAAIIARAAAIFQRGPPAPARAIYGTTVAKRTWAHGCMFTKPATPHKGKRSGAFADCPAGVSGVQPPIALTRPR
jgi:hypothetical protein